MVVPPGFGGAPFPSFLATPLRGFFELRPPAFELFGARRRMSRDCLIRAVRVAIGGNVVSTLFLSFLHVPL